jgi:hypothetical protein
MEIRMEIRETIEISGEQPSATVVVDDGDDTVTLMLGYTASTFDLAEAKRLYSLLGLAILAARHNRADFND